MPSQDEVDRLVAEVQRAQREVGNEELRKVVEGLPSAEERADPVIDLEAKLHDMTEEERASIKGTKIGGTIRTSDDERPFFPRPMEIDAHALIDRAKTLSAEADRAAVRNYLAPLLAVISGSVWQLADMAERMHVALYGNEEFLPEPARQKALEASARAIGDFNLIFHRVTGSPVGRSDLAVALRTLRRMRQEVDHGS